VQLGCGKNGDPYAERVSSPTFQRARSAEAKHAREQDILAAARALAQSDGVRAVTLTEVASRIGMHKSALLRYFETREQILLLLSAEEWPAWSEAVRARLDALPAGAQETALAAAFAETLTARPLFCDLLAHVPLSLERNVSVESVRRYKRGTGREVDAISAVLRRRWPALDEVAAVDVVATATSLAGAFWQMATPSPTVGELYRTDPDLAHAVVDVGPRLIRILTALLHGAGARATGRSMDA
jgi:AcrR family transcriptional regulator